MLSSSLLATLLSGLFALCLVCLGMKKNKKKKRVYLLIISAVLLLVLVKFTLLPQYHAATFEADLRKNYPLYEAIARHYPQEFNLYVEQVKQNIINTGEVDGHTSYSVALVNDALIKSIPFASAESLYRFLKISLKLDKKLYAINPTWVLVVESPGRETSGVILAEIGSSISEQDIQEKMQAETELIVSSSKNRLTMKLTDAEVRTMAQDLNDLMGKLHGQYGRAPVANTFSATQLPFADEVKSAQIIMSLYEDIIAKGEARGGLLFKGLYMQSRHLEAQDPKWKLINFSIH